MGWLMLRDCHRRQCQARRWRLPAAAPAADRSARRTTSIDAVPPVPDLPTGRLEAGPGCGPPRRSSGPAFPRPRTARPAQRPCLGVGRVVRRHLRWPHRNAVFFGHEHASAVTSGPRADGATPSTSSASVHAASNAGPSRSALVQQPVALRTQLKSAAAPRGALRSSFRASANVGTEPGGRPPRLRSSSSGPAASAQPVAKLPQPAEPSRARVQRGVAQVQLLPVVGLEQEVPHRAGVDPLLPQIPRGE